MATSNVKWIDLEGEIGKIQNSEIQDFVLKTLENCPDYFFIQPASSTGKYHPACSNQRGGLLVHVKRVIYFLDQICMAWGIFGDRRDIVIAAAIVHDIAKPERNAPYEEHQNHALNAERYFPKEKQGGEIGEFIEEIRGCVHHHMGRWTVKKILKPITDYTQLELAMTTADYLASVKTAITPMDDYKLLGPAKTKG